MNATAQKAAAALAANDRVFVQWASERGDHYDQNGFKFVHENREAWDRLVRIARDGINDARDR